MKEEFEISLGFKDWWLQRSDFPDTLIGRIMLDIAFSDSSNCSNKDAHLEALKHTAEEIIERIGRAAHNKEVEDE